MATHSSILAWRIPWTEEPSELQSMGLQRIRHNWVTVTIHYSRWQSKITHDLSLPMNISKIHLHMEQFSLITNWGWQKDSCTTKTVRKIHLESERKEKQSGQGLCPWEWLRGKGRLKPCWWESTGRRPPWGMSSSSFLFDPGFQEREDKTPWLVGGPAGARRGL